MKLRQLALAALSAAAFPATGQEVDLSPVYWDAAARSYLEEFNWTGSEIDKPLAVGKHGAITATMSAPAVYAGLQALQQGGTAADAVLTSALTEIALVGGFFTSYSGLLGLVYYEAETDRVYSLDAGFNSVLAEAEPMSIPRERNGRNVLVPGFMAGVEAAHKRFGELPWRTIFEPAIYYADTGFRLPQWFAQGLRTEGPLLTRLPESRSVFTRSDGEVYEEGDLFRQPQLARTLRAVVDEGAEYMYSGAWAEKFIEAVRREGGRISLNDMLAYKVTWSEPVQTSFLGYEVFASGLPAAGGVHVVEALNLAREAGLAGMPAPTKSAERFYWQSQIANVAALTDASDDRLASLGERLGMDITLRARAGRAYARALWAAITEGTIQLAKPPDGVLPGHSDAIVAIDQWGNVATMQHTINDFVSDLYVDGVSISHAARFQQRRIARVESGQRVPSGANSVIIVRDGQPRAALASIGTGLNQAMFSAILNLLSAEMEIKQAVDGPLLHLPTWSPDLEAFSANVIEGDFAAELLDRARTMGLDVAVHQRPGLEVSGSVLGATIDPVSGTINAAGARGFNALPFAY